LFPYKNSCPNNFIGAIDVPSIAAKNKRGGEIAFEIRKVGKLLGGCFFRWIWIGLRGSLTLIMVEVAQVQIPFLVIKTHRLRARSFVHR